MKESFKSCSEAFDIKLIFGFDDERIDSYQNSLGYNIPYDSKTFTEDFNKRLKSKCRDYSPSALTHEIFENHILKALDFYYEFISIGDFTFYVKQGIATSSTYRVDDGKTTGSSEVLYCVVYSVNENWDEIDKGSFEFTVK
jgi:hypothetical protein